MATLKFGIEVTYSRRTLAQGSSFLKFIKIHYVFFESGDLVKPSAITSCKVTKKCNITFENMIFDEVVS